MILVIKRVFTIILTIILYSYIETRNLITRVCGHISLQREPLWITTSRPKPEYRERCYR